MESKILNFPDAMRVAQIITKYIPDTESIKEMTGDELGYRLFGFASIDDIFELQKLCATVAGFSPETITSNIGVLVKNNLLDLLSTYVQLGVG